MTIKITVVAAAAFMLAAAPAFAQQGTTLAGPAQGQKSDGSASTKPSAESGANGGAMQGGAMSSTSGGAATGTMSGGSTATGGNVGGPAGRN